MNAVQSHSLFKNLNTNRFHVLFHIAIRVNRQCFIELNHAILFIYILLVYIPLLYSIHYIIQCDCILNVWRKRRYLVFAEYKCNDTVMIYDTNCCVNMFCLYLKYILVTMKMKFYDIFIFARRRMYIADLINLWSGG